MTRFGLFAALAVMAAAYVSQGYDGEGVGSVRDAEIRLDFQPFTDSMSMFVSLRGDGKASVVEYSPNQIMVIAAYEGVLPDPVVSAMLHRACEPVFRAALQRRDFGGKGLSRGDQFYLILSNACGRREGGRCFGFVPDAPAVVRVLIDDLLKAKGRLREVAPAGAYLRSAEIEKDRLGRMRSLGRVRFLSAGAFSSDLRPTVLAAIAHPFDFQALSEVQYHTLLAMVSQGREFFVLDDVGVGHQLTLFRSRVKAIAK